MATSNRNAELQAQYNQKKENIQTLVEKLNDLESQSDEHKVVIESLKPMPEDRKCFRMIGGTLVERTVGEVIPALEETRVGLKGIVEQLMAQYKKSEEEFQKWQKDNNIRVVSN